MAFQNTYIPYGGFWYSPFARWQGSFADLHPLKFAAEVAIKALAEREITPDVFTNLYLGYTVPSRQSFYGGPWLAGMIGAPGITGPIFSQACATSARVIGSAAFEIESGNGEDACILCITADRTSNGPHILYPNPLNPGGRGDSEDWVWDNFNCDPFTGGSMIQTAENVAGECSMSTDEQNEVMLMRYAQYQDALKDDAAFHKRSMVTPVEINPTGRKVIKTLADDEGVFPTTAEGLAKLKPVLPDGTVTYGGQTFPADGNAGLIVTSRERAQTLSSDPDIEIRLLAFAEGRAEKAHMPKANAPAIRKVLDRAGLKLSDMTAIKTHNPFVVNDLYLNRELNIPLDKMNNYGCSLIWGHPQAPTGMRSIIELIEELVLKGGGYGLFSGCAAGDTAAAIVLEVSAK
jgi:acetyl-CoA acetyltransferase